ncbi:MAG TPA: transcription antitermination factor NusB [Candidatus Atribacteria bacterium]|jgi:N utilization substance protein B|uniref:transcription antitermination factor NusB n=1 Tax=Candidatus Sordicultor fermentans TaxID=1953203 RepID=UPI0016965050|nr:transcription antitermination factor NusB [Atribacterota bacterium]NLY04764.1 transcription antitermination factor NusB [Candidatus Atribacteria bacterium]MDI9607910.1 transcription antitermination factor NusB [Atribacterota bacterium]MDY0134470.1 transcription antitermination factor NusB [Atribacterota bacterium]HOA98391.1 transcription antitermination factor NusB [Candidatus Atribacteria bacterium]
MLRRKARVAALQILFQMDMRDKKLEEVLPYFKVPKGWDEDTLSFFFRLVQGVETKKKEIDEILSQASEEWPLYRMANVDRNILRLAVFEILFLPEVPVSVAINEAVELGKKYGTEESGRFINGILGQLVRSLEERGNYLPKRERT